MGVDAHLFNLNDRGRTLLSTAVPFRPRRPRGRPASTGMSSVTVGLDGNVGSVGTELNASLSSSNEGERGRSRLWNDCAASP